MNESAKKFLERSLYVIFFLGAMMAVRAYKESYKPHAPELSTTGEDAERSRKREEFRKKMADFDAKQAASHAARVKRLGEAGAKAQEDRCDAELWKAFDADATGEGESSATPHCDGND
jgi:hypothetical protein